jgi:DNA-binding CsgD family transcriptional regulator
MIALTDLQNFLELMPKLYAPSSMIDFPKHVFSLLAELINLTDRKCLEYPDLEITFAEDSPATTRASQQIIPTANFPLTHAISSKLDRCVSGDTKRTIDRFPLFQHYFHQHQSTATRISDLLIESNSHRLEAVYWRFLKPIKLEDRLSKVFIDPVHPTVTHAIYLLQGDVICLTVSRDLCKWTEQDRDLLDLIRPHLIQAHHNAIVLSEVQTRLNSQDCHCRQSNVSVGFEGDNRSIQNLEPLMLADDDQLQLMNQLQEHQIQLFSIDSIQSIGLTKREAEVLYVIAKDKSNGEIAKLLNCSLSTVKKHLEHIYAKLNVQSRTAAVLHVLAKLGSIDT